MQKERLATWKHVNIEVKARCAEPDRIRTILKAIGAGFRGTDRQVDTYFKVSSGRLKLREGLFENALVFYEREDTGGPKQSSVILFQTDKGCVLKDMLIKAQGVLVVIDKTREIYCIENVKFHIDVVKRPRVVRRDRGHGNQSRRRQEEASGSMQ